MGSIINTRLLHPGTIALIVAITVGAHWLLAPVFNNLNGGNPPDNS